MIHSGDLPSGSKVSELSLAKKLRTSRAPIRGAIIQLAAEGYVEQVPRYGTIVRTPDRYEIGELYELRLAMESHAAYLAVDHLTEQNLSRLRQTVQEMTRIRQELSDSGKETLTEEQTSRFLAMDMGFHLMIIQACGNRWIAKLVADSRAMISIFGTPRLIYDQARLDGVISWHKTLLEAMERRDGEAARDAAAAHVRISKEVTLEHWDRMQRESHGRKIDLESLMPPGLVNELLHKDKADTKPQSVSKVHSRRSQKTPGTCDRKRVVVRETPPTVAGPGGE